MGPASTLAEDFEAALDWWQDAGVTHDFADDATAWLAQPEDETGPDAQPGAPPPPLPKPPPPPQRKLGGPPAGWPAQLPAFREWWLTEKSLDEGGTFPRLPSRGDEGAKLLVLVPEPEEDDTDRLLSGTGGRMVDRFLAAAGMAQEETAFAAILPRHTPMADWDELRAAGVADLLAHHVALLAPARILAFGRIASPLLGHESTQDAPLLPQFNHGDRSLPVMVEASLPELLRSPGRRKRLWQRWLDWTGP